MRYILSIKALLCLLYSFGINAQNIVVKPYLQNASPQSITIMWEADNLGGGVVRYGSSPFNLNLSATSSTEIGSGTSRIHTAVLSSLNSGIKYYYKVAVESGQESSLYTFNTPFNPNSEKSIQLMAISDMQRDGGHPNKFREIVEEGIVPIIYSQLGTSLNELEAILIPGDLVPTGGSYFQWKDYFFAPADSLFPYVPIYPVLGNHEYFGGGEPNFIKYFSLPANAPIGLEDQCWYKDISNVRIIGLNSNSGTADQNTQLDWLGQLLQSTCTAPHIDFVFAQLHHPFKSELWTPGENDFTGKVIDSLEIFSSSCNKPSIHFFGHTHAYSRGQSRDHKHLWINVATAGGAIDNWGEFPNADYAEFVKSQDEYGFVMIEVEAGYEPKFKIKRYSRGDQDSILTNVLTDELVISKKDFAPYQPSNIYPENGDTLQSSCLILKASEFIGVRDTMQASHWQIARGSNFIDSLVTSNWYQNENFYFEEDLQANDDLTDAEFNSIPGDQLYYWRVRYRNQNLEWSPWSESTTFFINSESDTISGNLLLNNGAENGIVDWIGDIESIENGNCNSVSPFAGSFNFAVGGVCANEMNVGLAYQVVDLSPFSSEITSGDAVARFGGFLRNFNGSDIPEMYIEYYQASTLLSTSNSISSNDGSWTFIQGFDEVPVLTDNCRIYLKGTRITGTDNDCYFDELHFQLVTMSCADCFGTSNTDVDLDGFCSDIDCDDTNEKIYPGAIELCDTMDNDCDGIADGGQIVTWTDGAGNQRWSDPDNWDQLMVPLACQYVVIPDQNIVLVDGLFACKGIITGPNTSLTIPPQAFLSVDNRGEPAGLPAYIQGLLDINGKWEVR